MYNLYRLYYLIVFDVAFGTLQVYMLVGNLLGRSTTRYLRRLDLDSGAKE